MLVTLAILRTSMLVTKSFALDVLLSEHRGCPTKVSFCCSVNFSVDFEKKIQFRCT